MTPLLHGGLANAADRFGDRIALRMHERSWTFDDVQTMAGEWSQRLAEAGAGPHDRVAIMSSNRPEMIVAVHAVSRLGGAAVLLSPAWKAAEVRHAVALTGPVRALGDGTSTDVLREVMGGDRVLDLDGAAPTRGQAPATEPEGIGPDDESILVFSSGTTGMPKAVRHTHGSIQHGIRHWVDALALGPDDRFQVATPPSHILGLLNLLAAFAAGATVRLHPRFDLEEVLRCIESDRTTLEMAVAPIALAMANHPDLERYDLSSLRYILWGATPVTESVARRVTERTGVRWLQGYGASEVPVITCNPVHRPDEWRLDSPGLPPDDIELRVVDLDTGEVLAPGEIGEIQVQSPSAMAGYLPEEATAEAFDDGWYRTGDVGWLEAEGWVHLTDRSKEMIKVKGFQVAPAEIEAVLHGHPSVLDCAVFGIPDERSGEVPVAAVQLDPERPATTSELSELVAASLATYKQLHHVVVVDTIPRLPSGKVLRRTLREEWSPALSAAEDSS
jgi:long-chain acyl-CoA synthetase